MIGFSKWGSPRRGGGKKYIVIANIAFIANAYIDT